MERINRFSPLVLSITGLLLTACGSDSEDDPKQRLSTASSVKSFNVSDQCPNGGVVISSGIDENGNGLLDVSEIDTNQTVCNGKQGNNSLVDVVDEPAGANCSAGGVKINSGLDLDNSGALDAGEITSTKYVCNGSDGQSSLIAISDEPAGNNCKNSGQKIEQGIDTDKSGTLEAGEVSLTRYICNGIDAVQPLVSTTELPAGHTTCRNGGFEASLGMDSNKNGTLDASEVADTIIACKPEENVLTAVFTEAAGANCAAGGAALKSGLDSNNNGVLDQAEVQNTSYVCNADISTLRLPPVIHTITSKPAVSSPNQQITLKLHSSDANNNIDNIAWFNAAGDQIGTGDELTINAPNSVGSYTYRAVVTDGTQLTATGTVEHLVAQTSGARDADSVTVGDDAIVIPDNISVPATNITGDVNGFIFVSGDNQQLTGFVIERPAYAGEQSTAEVITNVVNSMGTNLPATLVNILQRQGSSNALNLDYTLTLTADAKKSMELTTAAISQFGSSVAGGTITNPIAVNTNAVATNDYRIRLSVRYNAADSVQIAFAAVAAADYAALSTEFNAMADLSNAVPAGAKINSNTESFTFNPSNASPTADFLFVIDNSGSMSDEQTAIANAAQSFGNAMSSSNLDYHIGIITTDSTNLRSGAVIDNDLALFSSTINGIGTNGSATERGIYEAERALQSSAAGDAADGSFIAAGYPRAGASLSIIIMSDEPSQYPSSSGAFDPNNNLFKTRNYRVFSIINPSDAGQYDDLALATGGATADIGDVSTFPQMINLIGTSAGAVAAGFELAHSPIPGTIAVRVDGDLVPNNETNGWRYDSIANRVVLTGNQIPTNSAQLQIAYRYEVPPVLQSITLSVPAGSAYAGRITQIEATGSWDNGSTSTLTGGTWTSSDTAVATINETGELSGLTAGSTTISFEKDGETATVAVTIEPAALTLNSTFKGLPLAQGQSIDLPFTVTVETNFDVSSISSVDTYGELFDSQNQLITSNDDGGSGTNFRIVRTLAPGNYYLRFKGLSGRAVPNYEIQSTATETTTTP